MINSSIEMTPFALRHFDKTFGGTKVLIMSSSEFLDNLKLLIENCEYKLLDGYAPFCKLLMVKNFCKVKTGTMKITNENFIYLRSGYKSRVANELPVLSRWFDLPLGAQEANYISIVLYNKEQLMKESGVCDWKPTEDCGIVAILGQLTDSEEPMKPETMTRNALGIAEGGSDFPLDREKYMESVAFWSDNATVK